MRATFHRVILSYDGLIHRWCFENYYRDRMGEVIIWCTDQFGAPATFRGRDEPKIYPVAPVGRWAVYDWLMFSFRDEQDALNFKLRWG